MREKCLLFFDTSLLISLCGLIFAIPISKAGIEIFFTLSFILFIIKKILEPDFKFLNNWLFIFLSLFLLFNALSLINSAPYATVGQRAFFFKWLKNLLIFTMVLDTLANKKRVQYAFFVFLVTSIFVGMDGIIQRGLGYDLLWQHSLMHLKNGSLAITSTFAHYNSFGAYLVFPLAFVLSAIIQKKSSIIENIGFYLLAGLLEACLLLTSSRGAWLGFLGSLLFMIFLTKNTRKAAIYFVFFFCVLSGVLLTISLQNTTSNKDVKIASVNKSTVDTLNLASTRQVTAAAGESPWRPYSERLLAVFPHRGDSDRFIYWKAAYHMIKENPFLGKGVGTFMQRFPHYAPNVYIHYAHNCFLQIWAETGLLSLLSFLGFLWILFIRGIKTFRINKDCYLLGVLCGLFGFLAHSFFDTQLYTLHLSALFWSMAGILSALIAIGRKDVKA